MINEITENRFISNLTRQFRRSPMQLNQLHESDAEIVRMRASKDVILAVTTDSIAEEIAGGLYIDPFLMGWMTVMVNMSDLAAVAAEPLGIVVSQVLPPSYPESSIELLQKGIQAACEESGTFVLGGDTNFGIDMVLTGTALGVIDNGRVLSRRGCRPGDVLYATSVLGQGNAFALLTLGSSILSKANQKENPVHSLMYRPVARLTEAQCLNRFATSCMDTSDGVLCTLDQLMRLNNVGFKLDESWERTIEHSAKTLCNFFGVPDWLMLGGQHGEFELLFTIPRKREREFQSTAEEIDWKPLRLGQVIEEPSILLSLYGGFVAMDTGAIRNLGSSGYSGVESYLNQLMRIDYAIQKGVTQTC